MCFLVFKIVNELLDQQLQDFLLVFCELFGLDTIIAVDALAALRVGNDVFWNSAVQDTQRFLLGRHGLNQHETKILFFAQDPQACIFSGFHF